MKLNMVLSLLLVLLLGSSGYSGSQGLLDSLVFSSIEDEDYEQLEYLINNQRININNIYNNEHETPLHYAAFLGKTPAVKIFLEAGVDINKLTPQNYTALHLAAQQGYSDIVAMLLQYGADQTIRNQDGFLPVHLAASFGRLDATRLLIQSSGIVDMKGIHNVTPLQLAAQNGFNSIVLYLIGLGADLNISAEGSHGRSLHFAVHGDHPDTVELLLKNGALVNATNDTGDTPFVWNGYIGNVKIAQLLLEAGANTTLTTLKFKYNALHTASIRGKVELINYLLQQKVFNGNERSGSGSVALHYASLYGHVEAMKVLIPYTKNIDDQDVYGQTPLYYAISNNKPEAIQLLLKNKANPNIPNKLGDTPLKLAQRSNNPQLINLLKS